MDRNEEGMVVRYARCQQYGNPEDAARKMWADPEHFLRHVQRRLLPRHPLRVNLPLDDFVSRRSREVHRAGELLTARVTIQVARRKVFNDLLDDAFHEAAPSAFAVFV